MPLRGETSWNDFDNQIYYTLIDRVYRLYLIIYVIHKFNLLFFNMQKIKIYLF